MRIHILAVTQGKLPRGPFDDKTVFAIDGNGGGVIGKYRQFDALDPQPVIAQVNHFAHQRAAHATPVERCVNAHSEGGNVAPARSRLDAEHQVTDDAIVKSGDQMVAVWLGL